MTKHFIIFTFSTIDSVIDLTDTLEKLSVPFMASAVEYGGYATDQDAEKVFDHAQHWITLLREFIRDNNGTSA